MRDDAMFWTWCIMWIEHVLRYRTLTLMTHVTNVKNSEVIEMKHLALRSERRFVLVKIRFVPRMMSPELDTVQPLISSMSSRRTLTYLD